MIKVIKSINACALALASCAAWSQSQPSSASPSKADLIISSTNVGNGGRSSNQYSTQAPEQVVSWCGERLGKINIIKLDAAMAKLSGKDQTEIPSIYERGFEALIADFDRLGTAYSLTHRALIRGTEVATALATNLGSDAAALTTRIHFLEKYYDFVENISANLDIPFFVPFYNRGNNPALGPDLSEETFSVKLLQNAYAQLYMVLDNLTRTGPDGRVYPMGSPKGFLTAIEFTSRNAAEDMATSLVSTRMACVIGQLVSLNAKIASYNGGNRKEFQDRDEWAIAWAQSTTKRVLLELDAAIRDYNNYNCSGRGLPQAPQNPGQWITPRPDSPYPLPPNSFITPRP
jgi:hypothetical protein